MKYKFMTAVAFAGTLVVFLAAFGGRPPRAPLGAGYVVLGGIQQDNLTIFPVIASSSHDTGAFLTLDEGIRSGEVVVSEMGGAAMVRSGGGYAPPPSPEVNRLALVNNGSRPLLLLAGEIVTGGKQDRIVASDRIVPAHSGPIDLSVFCVEPGRWTQVSSNFASFNATMVAPSVRAAAVADQDQGEVWAEVRAQAQSVAANVPAPGTPGALTGTVADPTGATIPGARITATNNATGAAHVTTSQFDGSYRFAQLEPGNYTVRVEAPGFEIFKMTSVRIVDTAQIVLPARLAVGAATQTVEITGEAPLRQPASAGPTTVLAAPAIEDIPSIAIAGGVQGDNSAMGSLRGGGSSGYSIDGASDNADAGPGGGGRGGASSYATAMAAPEVQRKIQASATAIDQTYGDLLKALHDRNAVGVVVAVNGRIVWADLFASPELLQRYWPKLLSSYVAESVANPGKWQGANAGDAQAFLDDLTGVRETATTVPDLYRESESTGSGFKVIHLTALLPKTGFDLHIAKIAR